MADRGQNAGNAHNRRHRRSIVVQAAREEENLLRWTIWFVANVANQRGWRWNNPLLPGDTWPRLTIERGFYYLIMMNEGWPMWVLVELENWEHFPLRGLTWQWQVAQWLALRAVISPWRPEMHASHWRTIIVIVVMMLEYAENPLIWGGANEERALSDGDSISTIRCDMSDAEVNEEVTEQPCDEDDVSIGSLSI
jgi:hypothetical protein